MNRSFRATESRMQGGFRQQQMAASMSMRKEKKEDELDLFLEMRKREKEKNNLLLLPTEREFDAPLGSKPGTSPIFNIASSTPARVRKTGPDDFLNSENDKNDYDWLITPPGTPLFPSLEMESQRTIMSQMGTPKARPTALKSRLSNPQSEPVTRNNLVSKQSTSSPGLNSSSLGMRRPSSSGGPGSRPATPTGRPTLPASSRPSRSSTPTSRSTLPAAKATVLTSSIKSSVPSRSTTPSRSSARSSTPTARPSIPATKPASRSATPTRRPSTSISASSTFAPPVKTSSVTKSGPAISKPSVMTSTRSSVPAATKSSGSLATKSLSPTLTKSLSTAPKNPSPSRGTSPTVRSRAWKPSEMPGFSLDAPPNLRTSAPDRPLSASRGRPGAPSARSSSVEPGLPGRPRRQSCSPSRGRLPNVAHHSGSSVPAVRRGHSIANDSVNPVLMGTKMVERVINMRKLVPPRKDDKHSPNLSGKSASSPDSTGFGRTLSKKSLDMAIRHMDIRRSIPGNLRPLMTNIPASSMYSVRSGPTRSRAVSVSDSPLATSSNASSELSVSNNGLCLDGFEVEDEISSQRGGRSPASLRGR